MLRQVYIYHNQKPIFSYALALGFSGDELKRVIENVEPNMILPTPGKTFNRSIAKFQVFHRSYGNTYFIIIVDLIDTPEYVEDILIKIINKFKDYFANPDDIIGESPIKTEFIKFLYNTQNELHSKIAIVGPYGSGKTTLYNLLRSGQERKIMDFANASIYAIDKLHFELWDFILEDNFSLLWAKFIGGSDLVILLFDSKDYGPKLIQYFTNIIENHGKYSKVLVIANKSEFTSDEELEHIKNSVIIQDIKKLSLIKPDKAKEDIELLIMDALNLKKNLPSHFKNLQQEAEKLTSENNISEAIVKYEELIKICNEFQEYDHLELFQTNLKKLTIKLEQKLRTQKKLRNNRSFTPPEKRSFSKKVSVKSLPKSSGDLKSKTISTLKNAPKSNEIFSPSIEQKETIPELDSKRLKINLEDFETNLRSNLEKIQQIKKPKSKEVLEETKTTDLEHTKVEIKPSLKLKKLIIDEGTDLNIELCEFFIKEMKENLKSEINKEDLKLAAENFYKIEKSLF